ncbi:hypothetical protein K9M79_07315 [Candidatus Woesearchaeota archaeon]|nr:hypothetical protein [Candidatus Woesearchaeota archaeon]
MNNDAIIINLTIIGMGLYLLSAVGFIVFWYFVIRYVRAVRKGNKELYSKFCFKSTGMLNVLKVINHICLNDSTGTEEFSNMKTKLRKILIFIFINIILGTIILIGLTIYSYFIK